MPSLWRVRCSISGVVAGPALSQFFFDEGGGSASAAVSAVQAFWTSLAGVMHTATVIRTEPDVSKIDTASGELVSVTPVTSVSVAGTDGGTLLPREVQGLLQLRTGFVNDGSEVRGRLFIPGPCTARNNSGSPFAAYLTSLETAGNGLIAAATAQWMVYRRKREHRPAVGPGPGHPRGLPELPERPGAAGSVSAVAGWNEWAGLKSRRT